MLAINSLIKIYLHAEPVDMRKSFDGLFGIIKSDLHLDVRDGGVFMFLNLRRNRIKLIHWDRDGLVIWMKHEVILVQSNAIVVQKSQIDQLTKEREEFRAEIRFLMSSTKREKFIGADQLLIEKQQRGQVLFSPKRPEPLLLI